MHGGASTGPRTPEGLEKSRKARWIDGEYSRVEAAEDRRAWEEFVRLTFDTFAPDSLPSMPAKGRRPWKALLRLLD
jgi:hypothetical protein